MTVSRAFSGAVSASRRDHRPRRCRQSRYRPTATAILSGHVHNYQRFTVHQSGVDVPCVVAGNGGYSELGKLHKVGGQWPEAPMELSDTLTFEQYDQNRFGFLRCEINRDEIVGIYTSAIFEKTRTPVTKVMDKFTVDMKARKVATTA